MTSGVQIVELTVAGAALFTEHFARHRAESGQGEWHFMPFAPDDPAGPTGVDATRLGLPLTIPGWMRCFVACVGDDARFVGHVDLKGDSIATGAHRCELGIGIERAYRSQGLGRRLMQRAIDYVRAAPSIDWLDLKVFAHNLPARGLYRSLGFLEIGTVQDRFRIDGASIDDVIMTLNVRGEA